MTEKIIPKHAAFRRAHTSRPQSRCLRTCRVRPTVWIVQRRRRVCKNQVERAAGEKGKPAWLRFWPILMMC